MSGQTRLWKYMLLGLGLGILAAAPLAAQAQGVEETEAYRITQGGKIYDKWYTALDSETPEGTHPAYPAAGQQSGAGTYRCKECHGWDYMGAAGAYATGSHATGIVGIRAAEGGNATELTALIRGGVHKYSAEMIPDEDLDNLVLFLVKGQVDMDQYIDRASKAPKGDAGRGAAHYQTICAVCHGLDGKEPSGMNPFGAQMGNPWEVMHKILNGQPDEDMPAMRSLDRQVIVDIMAYLTTLPKE